MIDACDKRSILGSRATDRMSVADFLREAEALRRLLFKEERAAGPRALTELRDHMNAQLRADIMKVQQQLQKLKNGVFRFQEQLMDVRPSPDVIDKLKETMTDIENSISVFKDTQHQRYEICFCRDVLSRSFLSNTRLSSFEELLKEERTFSQEICAFEKKMDSWSLPVKAEVRRPRSDEKSDWRNLPPELTALQTFLQQTGGRHGGWDEFDHHSFLKVWTKHGGKPSFRREARLYLPGRTEEDVRLHEEWFVELRRLQERQREAIRKWRASKRREHELQRDRDEEPQEDEARRLLKQEEQRREESERLEAWRRHRTQQREEERQQRLRDQILQRRRAQEERRRQLELKLLVEAHARQKKEQEELRLLEEEAQEQAERQERQRQAAEGIRRFQERDSRRLEEKLQEKQSKEEEQSERLRTLDKLKEKVEAEVSRDPSRLWKLTKVWEERTKEIGPSGTGPMFQIFRRAVPSWRQDS
uniref:Coiled-coil domain containing 112 n=1 Tax=Cyprinus carpio carpio TaxID=630221 RepID=A0A9J8ASS8_CYPCA